MKTTLKATVVVIAAFAISSGIFGNAAPVMAQMQTGGDTATSPNMSMGMGEEGGDMMMSMMHEMMANHKWGMISSINNDGEADWIISGHWVMDMASQNETATSNATTGTISNIAGFNAILNMVMLDGSAMHNHEISNFTQTEDATFDSSTNTTTITGTITITMREGPVPNVPTTIQIAQDQVIAISPEAAALENHFGTAPIYGIVVTPEMMEQMMMRYSDKTGMGDMTGMSGMMQGPMDGTMMMNSSGGM
jgi:hypothetical protein